jgi:hypothetical protein
MPNPAPFEHYNLACFYAQLPGLLQKAASPPTAAERASLADRALDTLRRAVAAGMTDFAVFKRDPDLDPLRQRPDFRALMRELAGRTRAAEKGKK